ncbi:MAG: hypothetical protein R6U57_04635 [Anaerolineales bacterium]
MQHPSKSVRLSVTILLIVAAILIIVLEPLLVKGFLPKIIASQQARIEKFSASDDPELQMKAQLISKTPEHVSWGYPLWMALGVFGGVVLLVIARDFYRGKKWARGLALLALAMPSMGGAYMFVPWMNFVKEGFPPPMIIALFGLVPYFTILLAEKVDGAEKAINAIVFAIIGVQGAHAFTNGFASLRFQWMHPGRPAWPGNLWGTWLGTQVMWLGCICVILSIHFLGARKRSGWYLALIGGGTTMVANYYTHIVRGTTIDYILGGTFGLIIVVLMLIPGVKNKLLDDVESESELAV